LSQGVVSPLWQKDCPEVVVQSAQEDAIILLVNGLMELSRILTSRLRPRRT
jgi:hypothetical protein